MWRKEWGVVIGREAGSKRHGTLARDEGGGVNDEGLGRRLMFVCVYDEFRKFSKFHCFFLCGYVEVKYNTLFYT